MTAETPEVTAPARTEIDITGEPTGLYRFYNRAGVLLYVGISRNLASRWADHATDKTWWPLVARKTVAMYGSRTEAEAAELEAIRTENPLRNVAGRTPPKKLKRTPPDRAKVIALLSQPPRSVSLGFDEWFRSHINAYAEERGREFGDAVMSLLHTGLIVEEMEAEMTLDERYEALKARVEFDKRNVA